MGKSVKGTAVEKVIRSHLLAKGYSVSHPRGRGETGVDIEGKKDGSRYLVEAIGFQDNPPVRSREFYEAFFRVVSRDRDEDSDVLVMGLPKRFKRGMRQRMQQYPVAWGKLGRAFPNLQIWYVDTESGSVEEHSWSSPYD